MLLFWVLIGTQTAHCLRNAAQKKTPEKKPLLPVVFMMAAVIIGIVLQLVFPSGGSSLASDVAAWLKVNGLSK